MRPLNIFILSIIALSIAGLIAYWGPREIYSPEQMQSLRTADLLPIDQITIGKNSKTAKFWSDFIQNGSIVLAIVAALFLYYKNRKKLIQALLFVGLALSLNLLGINLAKNGFSRPRPWMYLESFQERGVVKYTDMLSHYSGHTSTAFAMLTAFFILLIPFISKNNKITVGVLAFCIASTCGWLRIEAGYHYFTDVIHGAIWGTILTVVAARLCFGKKLRLEK